MAQDFEILWPLGNELPGCPDEQDLRLSTTSNRVSFAIFIIVPKGGNLNLYPPPVD